MKIDTQKSIYEVKSTTKFNKQIKKVAKQHKNIEELITVVEKLANNQKLDKKYKDHQLTNDKTYKNCRECHISPD